MKNRKGGAKIKKAGSGDDTTDDNDQTGDSDNDPTGDSDNDNTSEDDNDQTGRGTKRTGTPAGLKNLIKDKGANSKE